MSDLDLANLVPSKSDWHSRRARVVLQGRAAKGPINPEAVAQLRNIFEWITDDSNNVSWCNDDHSRHTGHWITDWF